MAQVEFTQQWKHTVANAGVFNTIFFQMQPTAGTYIVKGLTCYSTSGIQVPAGVGGTISFTNATNSAGANIKYIYIVRDAFDANQVVIAYSPFAQLILTGSYIGVTANMAGAGDFVFQISYSFIPSTNVLAANFSNNYSQTLGGATGSAFSGSSSTIATIIKSIYISNQDENGNTATITPLITTPTNPVATPFAASFDLTAGNSQTLAPLFLTPENIQIYNTIPLYLNSSTTISFQNVGMAPIEVLYSYTHETT